VMLEGEIVFGAPIGEVDRQTIGHAMAGAHE
jgi:hypothetical protein